MSATFRPLTLDDDLAVLPWMQELYAQDKIPIDTVRWSGALHALIGDPSLGRAIAIDVPAGMVGYLILTFGYSLEYGGRDAFIDELYIAPEFRRQGLGTAALEFAADLCRTLGIQALHLEVDHANADAHSLYRRLGFQDHERHLMTRRL